MAACTARPPGAGMDEGERIDAAADRRDCCKAWTFIVVLSVVSLAALAVFLRLYSWLLFARSSGVCALSVIYMFLFIFVDKDYNIKTMIQMRMNGRPVWLIKLFNQWNNIGVFVCAGAPPIISASGPAAAPHAPLPPRPPPVTARDCGPDPTSV